MKNFIEIKILVFKSIFTLINQHNLILKKTVLIEKIYLKKI